MKKSIMQLRLAYALLGELCRRDRVWKKSRMKAKMVLDGDALHSHLRLRAECEVNFIMKGVDTR
jgi:hypothetical protein